jgi:cytochrome c oxidase subunit 2
MERAVLTNGIAPLDWLLLPSPSSLWLPPNGSLHGIAVDRLLLWNLAAMGGLFLVAHILMAGALLRRHRDARAGSSGFAASLPVLALCGLYVWMAVAAQRLWAANRFEGPSPEAMQVEVTGVQFQWYFRYPGTDATFGAAQPELVNAGTGNPLGIDPLDAAGNDDIVSSEFVLPAGREVDLRLTAHDVIHGFFIPGMRLKQNALPGQVLHVHFTPETVGEYPILCTQVCGLGHGHMQARLRVMTPRDFDLWLQRREERRLAQTSQTSGAQ